MNLPSVLSPWYYLIQVEHLRIIFYLQDIRVTQDFN
jgi:hypothetical protein